MSLTPIIYSLPLADDQKISYYVTGPAEASSFTITLTPANGSPFDTVFPASATPILTISSLTNGVKYGAQIIAADGATTGDAAVFRTMAPGLLPSDPQNVAIDDSVNGLVLSWEFAASNGGSEIGYYVVKDQTDQSILYNTLANQSTITIPIIPGHDSYTVHSVNDPGYSPGALAVLPSETYFLYNRFITGPNSNFYFQIYSPASKQFNQAIDTEISFDNYCPVTYQSNVPSYPTNFGQKTTVEEFMDVDDNNQHIVCFLANTGQLTKVSTIVSDQTTYANFHSWFRHTTEPGFPSTHNLYLYNFSTQTLKQSTLESADYSAAVQTGFVLKDTAYFVMSNTSSLSNELLSWYSGWDQPSTLLTSGLNSPGFLFSNVGSNGSVGYCMLYDPVNSNYTSTLALYGDGTISSITLSTSNDTIVTSNVFGSNKNCLVTVMGQTGVDNNDVYIFRYNSTLETFVYPSLLSTANSFSIFAGTNDVYSFSNTGVTNTIGIAEKVQSSNFGPINIFQGPAQFLFDSEVTLRSTLFDGNTWWYDGAVSKGGALMTFVDPVTDFLGMCGINPSQISSNIVYLPSAVYSFGNIVIIDSNFLIRPTIDSGASNNNFLLNVSSFSIFNFFTTSNTIYNVTGNTLMAYDKDSTELYTYNGNQLASNIFTGGSNAQVLLSQYAEPTVGRTLWCVLEGNDTLSTIALYDGVLGTAVGLPFNSSGTFSNAAIQNRLFTYNYSSNASSLVVNAIAPNGTVDTFEYTQGLDIEVRYMNNTERVMNITGYDSTLQSSFNVTYDMKLSTFASTFISNLSSGNLIVAADMETNYPFDIFQWNYVY